MSELLEDTLNRNVSLFCSRDTTVLVSRPLITVVYILKCSCNPFEDINPVVKPRLHCPTQPNSTVVSPKGARGYDCLILMQDLYPAIV